MISLDTKFFEHLITCLKRQKEIHLQPFKTKIQWQDNIDKTVVQCETILTEARAEEQKKINKSALFVDTESTIFDSGIIESFSK